MHPHEPMISDRTLITTRKAFGYTAVTAAVSSVAAWVVDPSGLVPVALLSVGLVAVVGWFRFRNCLEVRRAAERFRSPGGRNERDLERDIE